nr:beta-lactamase family protein [Pseudofrankia sp. DC12]
MRRRSPGSGCSRRSAGPARRCRTTGPATRRCSPGVHSTCRDLARFGQLALGHGVWHGKQIVSADWLRAATGTSSTQLNAAYGYLWWLNHEGLVGNPLVATDLSQVGNQTSRQGRLVAGARDDMFWATGLGSQVVQVDPATDTVVVGLGTPDAVPRPPTFGPAEASRVVTQAVTGAAKPATGG